MQATIRQAFKLGPCWHLTLMAGPRACLSVRKAPSARSIVRQRAAGRCAAHGCSSDMGGLRSQAANESIVLIVTELLRSGRREGFRSGAHWQIQNNPQAP